MERKRIWIVPWVEDQKVWWLLRDAFKYKRTRSEIQKRLDQLRLRHQEDKVMDLVVEMVTRYKLAIESGAEILFTEKGTPYFDLPETRPWLENEWLEQLFREETQ